MPSLHDTLVALMGLAVLLGALGIAAMNMPGGPRIGEDEEDPGEDDDDDDLGGMAAGAA